MIIGSIIYSIGSAVTYPTLSSLISKGTPATHQGEVIGKFQASNSVARIIAPLLGGVLYDKVGMTAPFFAAAVIALLTVLTSLKLLGLKKDRDR